MKNKKTNTLYSWPFIVLCFFLCWPVSVILIISRFQQSKKENAYMLYKDLILHRGMRNLSEISTASGKLYIVVKYEIQEMINHGILVGAYIDKMSDSIVFTAPQKESLESYTNEESLSNTSELHPAAAASQIRCPNCGACQTLINGIGECEDCGTPL